MMMMMNGSIGGDPNGHMRAGAPPPPKNNNDNNKNKLKKKTNIAKTNIYCKQKDNNGIKTQKKLKKNYSRHNHSVENVMMLMEIATMMNANNKMTKIQLKPGRNGYGNCWIPRGHQGLRGYEGLHRSLVRNSQVHACWKGLKALRL